MGPQHGVGTRGWGRLQGAPGAQDTLLPPPPSCRELGAEQAGAGGAAAALVAGGRGRPGSQRRVRGEGGPAGEQGPAQHHPAQKPGRPPVPARPPRPRSLRLCGFLPDPSALALSSAPSPQAEGGAGEMWGPGFHPDPEHLRGRGRPRRGREPGMEARRAEGKQSGRGCPRVPQREGLWGAGHPRVVTVSGQRQPRAPTLCPAGRPGAPGRPPRGPGAAGGAGPGGPLGLENPRGRHRTSRPAQK